MPPLPHPADCGAQPTTPPIAHDQQSSTCIGTLGWQLLLAGDCLVFVLLFAAYGVLAHQSAGGPSGAQVFDLRIAFGETMLLLASSFTVGVSTLALEAHSRRGALACLAATAVLGLAFIGMHAIGFAALAAQDAFPGRSPFLSAYFALVGSHVLHVAWGVAWMVRMLGQVASEGFSSAVRRRLARLGLFWHFLDLVWICAFAFVYLREYL